MVDAYRTADVGTIVHYPPRVGRGHLIRKQPEHRCKRPGSLSRWLNEVKRGDIWRCSECGASWRWALRGHGSLHVFEDWDQVDDDIAASFIQAAGLSDPTLWPAGSR
jgi:hypothetical protein